ncbi:MAG: SpoIIE family protein phosphatase [Bacillota bacterium]
MFENNSLKPQLLKIIIIIYLLTSLTALVLIYYTLNDKINDLGTRFATQYLLKEKNRITSPIEKEIAITEKMVDTPILQRWAQNEDDPKLKEMAIKELESYRRHFQDKSYFFIADESKHYYFNNKKNEFAGEQYRYTLDEDNPDDEWYFSTMEDVDDFYLNVNVDRELQLTKLWIDAIMYNQQGEKIGMGGTGLTLDRFLNRFLKSENSYITPILFDQRGYIQAYENEDYIKLSAISSEVEEGEKKTIFELLENKEEKMESIMDGLKEDSEEIHTIDLNLNGQQRIAAVTYIPTMDWYIMTLLDTSEIISIWDFMFTISVLIISLLLIVLGIIYFFNRIVINPIDKLNEFTEVMAAGNYEQRIDLDAENELGDLANSFNDMAATINKHTDHLEDLVEQRTAELTKSNQELEAKNEKIMQNQNYAQYIQQSILAKKDRFENNFEDYFIIWQPKDKVGGDFYWMRQIEDRILIAVVDCTGHGMPGALMTMTSNAILNRIVDTEATNNPADFLEKLDIFLKESLHENNDGLQRDDGLDIGLCSINKEEGKLVFAGARIPLYYSDNDEIIRVKGDRKSIGYRYSKKDIQYSNHEVEIKQDRVFYMASDGYIDQNGANNNKRFGRSRFVEMLTENHKKDLETQQEIFTNELKDHQGAEEQRDDITVLGFKIEF